MNKSGQTPCDKKPDETNESLTLFGQVTSCIMNLFVDVSPSTLVVSDCLAQIASIGQSIMLCSVNAASENG